MGNQGFPYVEANDWNNLFWLLADKVKTGRVVIVLDEISWMGSKDPDFLEKLKNTWDLHFKKNPKLILILCGSVSAWIEENILANTGFLGRPSFTLTLEELSLKECNEFWITAGKNLSAYEKFKILAIVGGIPRYLEEIQPQQPAEENIRNLCLKKGGLLVEEFERIFSDLFTTRSQRYKELVECLVEGPLEYTQICEKTGTPATGLMSDYLNDLIKSGFIRRDYTWNFKTGKISKLSHYRLSDNYLRFYLKYIEKYPPEIQKNNFKVRSLSSLPGWSAMMGLQFENLVLNNRDYIYECLHIRAEDIVSENPYFQRKTARYESCQIDYLIQTRFNMLFVCEIKFSQEAIKADVINEVKQKINRLALPRGFSCCPVLIHINGVKDSVNDYGYFTEIIDFSDLLMP